MQQHLIFSASQSDTVLPGGQAGKALLETDCQYFELAAGIQTIDASRIAAMPAIAHTSVGCVCQRVNEESLATNSRRIAWLAALETAFRRRCNPTVRIYLTGDTNLGEWLGEQGFVMRTEIGFARYSATRQYNPRVSLTPVDNDQDWREKQLLHASSGDFPDGHQHTARQWTGMERAKCATGRMQCFLIRYDSKPVGAIGTMKLGGLLRLKNLVLHPEFRKREIATAAIGQLSRQVDGRHSFCLGAFGVEGGIGEKLYRSVGMKPVCVQFEWTRQLSQERGEPQQ